LPYRSLEFELRTEPTPSGGYLQDAPSINEPSEDVPYTRTTEFRQLSDQQHHHASTVAVEYPRTEGDPYYPIPNNETRELYRRYQALAGEVAEILI
jgi:UDP-galactopyranose mutase